MQGLFELAGIAYVGAGVVGSAVGMDKGIFKDVMVANNIPVVDTLVVLRRDVAGLGCRIRVRHRLSRRPARGAS